MTMLAKWLRRASSMFAEKPEAKIDDFGLEHILLYHGLAGSSPENQRQFKDVRSDILSAISRKNSQNLCINLKIAPLWWEDKLHRIFDEARSQSSENTLSSLLPTTGAGEDGSQSDPLMHEDWRVRANAASILNFLQVNQAQERMIEALHDTAGSASPAFCHLARSLSGFRTEAAKIALTKHLGHSEPWIRVDSVNALSKWPLDEIAPLLIQAFAQDHDFIDYASVAVARTHKPIDFLEKGEDDLTDLGAAILLGAMEAAEGTFSSNSDLLPEVSVQKCLTPLQNAAAKSTSPVRLRALIKLSQWLDDNYHQYRLEAEGYPQPEEIAAARAAASKYSTAIDLKAAIQSALAGGAAASGRKSTVRHAIKLAGELQSKECVGQLMELLSSTPIYCNDAVEALGLIGDGQCVPVLIKLAKSLVNLDSRTQNTLSANPISEAEPEKAKTYWLILRALGNLQSDEALAFLLTASQDEAPDKREEALSSLILLWSKSQGSLARAGEVKATLKRCLSDPSSQVRIKAMEGAAILNLPELIGDLVGLINAQEMSVSKGAFSALEKLAQNGHKEPIRAALSEAKASLNNTVKVKRIDEFIQHHL